MKCVPFKVWLFSISHTFQFFSVAVFNKKCSFSFSPPPAIFNKSNYCSHQPINKKTAMWTNRAMTNIFGIHNQPCKIIHYLRKVMHYLRKVGWKREKGKEMLRGKKWRKKWVNKYWFAYDAKVHYVMLTLKKISNLKFMWRKVDKNAKFRCIMTRSNWYIKSEKYIFALSRKFFHDKACIKNEILERKKEKINHLLAFARFFLPGSFMERSPIITIERAKTNKKSKNILSNC